LARMRAKIAKRFHDGGLSRFQSKLCESAQ
jgi:hypothetical protein